MEQQKKLNNCNYINTTPNNLTVQFSNQDEISWAINAFKNLTCDNLIYDYSTTVPPTPPTTPFPFYSNEKNKSNKKKN